MSERERLEREKHVLQLENVILRLERRLPPGPGAKGTEVTNAPVPGRTNSCRVADIGLRFGMSKAEILEQLPKLGTHERQEFLDHLCALQDAER